MMIKWESFTSAHTSDVLPLPACLYTGDTFWSGGLQANEVANKRGCYLPKLWILLAELGSGPLKEPGDESVLTELGRS